LAAAVNLSLKASKCRRILRHCRWQHLDRHDAVHPAMLSPENLPHAPAPILSRIV